MIGFPLGLYSHTIFLWCGNTKYLELIKRRSKVEKNVTMACLQIYRQLLSLATFFRVHSNSEEVSYLS